MRKTGEVLLAEDHDATVPLPEEGREMAAVLLASHKPKTHVAKRVGVTMNTFYDWVHDPVFAARVEFWRAVNYKSATEAGIGNAKVRIIGLVDTYERHLQIVIDRGNDPFWDGYPADPECTMCLKPGTTTGERQMRLSWPECPNCGYRVPFPEGKQGYHYYRHMATTGNKPLFPTVVHIFQDKETPKLLMALNKQIAEHLGEWNTQAIKHDVVIRQIVGINSDDL